MELKTDAIFNYLKISENEKFGKVYEKIYEKFFDDSFVINKENPIYSVTHGLVTEFYDKETKKNILKYEISYSRIDNKPLYILHYKILYAEHENVNLFL